MKTTKGKPFGVERAYGIDRQKYWYVVDSKGRNISGGWLTKEAAEHDMDILLKKGRA